MRAALLVIGGLIGTGYATSCHADNCLRAIRATSRLSSASAACSAYIQKTVTPSTVTVTEYNVVSEVAQATVYTTRVDTFFDTYTSVIEETATTTLPGTTLTSTVYNPALKKRQAAPTIPAFASPCSGAVRFTSACSCIGVSAPQTITLPTPTTTLILTTTTTYSTEINIVTAETLSTTITDATVSVVNTLATVTLPGPSATTTLTVPYPALCKNIVLYNGLRPTNFGTYSSVDVGTLSTPDCCLRCFQTPNCQAYVINYNGPGSCLVLFQAATPPNPPSPRCPGGVGSTVFGSPPGSVGMGPCQGISEWN